MVKKKRKSKRQTLTMKYRVDRFAKAHKKKMKKIERKRIADGGVSKKHKKDPGIPNNWPFKAEILKEARRLKEDEEEQKREARRLREKNRRKRRREMETLKQVEEEAKQAKIEAGKERREEARKDRKLEKKDMEDPSKVLVFLLKKAHIIVQVLDARDPQSCLCPDVEVAAKELKKPVVIALNRIDLIPAEYVEEWLSFLRRSSGVAPLEGGIGGGGIQGLNALLQSRAGDAGVEDEAVRVAIVGRSGVGVGTVASRLKKLDTVHVLEPTGWVANQGRPLTSAIMIGGDVHVKDPVETVCQVVERCDVAALMGRYCTPRFETPIGFLQEVAMERVGGSSDAHLEKMALSLLREWKDGGVAFCATPPPSKGRVRGGKVTGEAALLGRLRKLLGGRFVPCQAADPPASVQPLVLEEPKQEEEQVSRPQQKSKRVKRKKKEVKPPPPKEDDAYDFGEFFG